MFKWIGAYRPAAVTLDKGLVMAAWWMVTRSMVTHSVILGIMLIVIALVENPEDLLAYQYILSWGSIWGWGVLIMALALLWLWSKAWTCVAASAGIVLWYFAFATQFFITWLTVEDSGTAATAWVTYFFLGWSWLLVTYVVWRDERHVRAELARITGLREEIKQYEHGGQAGDGNAEE